MGAISGLLGLQNGTSSNEWVSEYQDTILVRNARGLNAGSSLFGLMSKLKNEPAETVEFSWFERDPVTRVVAIDNAGLAYGDSDATIVVDAGVLTGAAAHAGAVGGLLQAGTVLRTEGGEMVRVNAAPTDNASGYTTIVVDRAFGGTTKDSAGLANGKVLSIITFGRDEGSTPANAVFETASTYTNFIQTFNAAVYLTNAFKSSKLRTDIEGPLRERRVQALERIARDIELAYFFGVKATTYNTYGNNGGVVNVNGTASPGSSVAATGRFLYTGGIVNSVDQIGGTVAQAISGDGSGNVTLAAFNDWLASFLTLGSDAKLAFCGPKAYAAISNFANIGTNGFRITGQENVFGMNITEINTPFGVLSLAMHPLFKEISVYNDWMVVADLGLLVQKVMEPLFLEPNIQAPGTDAYMEQFRAKYGLKLKFPQAFGYAKQLQKLT